MNLYDWITAKSRLAPQQENHPWVRRIALSSGMSCSAINKIARGLRGASPQAAQRISAATGGAVPASALSTHATRAQRILRAEAAEARRAERMKQP
jgi:DNA-binding transcriptional regulator YdaS (Cro superfamily)